MLDKMKNQNIYHLNIIHNDNFVIIRFLFLLINEILLINFTVKRSFLIIHTIFNYNNKNLNLDNPFFKDKI